MHMEKCAQVLKNTYDCTYVRSLRTYTSIDRVYPETRIIHQMDRF